MGRYAFVVEMPELEGEGDETVTFPAFREFGMDEETETALVIGNPNITTAICCEWLRKSGFRELIIYMHGEHLIPSYVDWACVFMAPSEVKSLHPGSVPFVKELTVKYSTPTETEAALRRLSRLYDGKKNQPIFWLHYQDGDGNDAEALVRQYPNWRLVTPPAMR